MREAEPTGPGEWMSMERGAAGPRQTLTAEGLRVQGACMRSFTAVVEKCADTGLYVGYVPGFSGAHSQGESLDALRENLEEVLGMLLEEGEPPLESEFVGTQTIQVR